MASKNHCKICFSSSDATEMLIDPWLEETIQFALESSKTSKETRKGYSTLQVSNTFYLILFDNMHVLKDCEVSPLSIEIKGKLECQVFLVLFLHFKGKAKTGLHGLPMCFFWLRRIIKAFKLQFCCYEHIFKRLTSV